MITEADLTEKELGQLRALMDAVPFSGNYSDLGEGEEIRRDFLLDIERERAR